MFTIIDHNFIRDELNDYNRLQCNSMTYFLVVFLLRKKLLYVVTRDVSPSVRPSSVEISLERGCTITNRPIDLKFGLSIGGGVMHV